MILVKLNDVSTDLSVLTKQNVASVSNYNGYQISSVVYDSGVVNYCLNDDQLAFSYSKILVEDYIRAFEDKSASLQELALNSSKSLLLLIMTD